MDAHMHFDRTLRSRLGRALLVVASMAAVLGLGAVAAFAQLDTTHALQRAHLRDRDAVQATLSGLTAQYFTNTFLATQTAANQTSWHFNATDSEHLHHLAGNSPLTSYGAALVSLNGTTLAQWSRSGALPAVTHTGLSDVLRSGTDDVVAFGVPVFRDGRTAALLVAYADAHTWSLESYDRSLRLSRDAVSYVLDSHRVIAASGDQSSIGTRLDLPLSSTTKEITWHGRQLVVSAGDAGHGWTMVTAQGASSWSPGVAASRQRAMIALAVLLTFVVGLLLWFHLRQQTALRRLADERLHDPLTGLPQRPMFDVRLQAAFARQQRHGDSITLLYCDLDEFKAVNDQYGHGAGDQLLRTVGERLTAAVRGDDFVVRFGGDEFGVLVEGLTLLELHDLMRRIHAVVEQPVPCGRIDITPRLSVGGAITRGGHGGAELVHAADLAMYQVKAGATGPVVTDLAGASSLPERAIELPLPR
jgi:diguanylate cyclase (GGDEF)-like protein